MKRLFVATAALVAAVAVFVLISLPPAHLTLDTSWDDGSVPGLLHVHSNRSDGLSSPEEIAAAAARAGAKFLVFTDHGDATRKPEPAVYRAGVLCLDGVEISTSNGHYVAIGMPAAPYPLGGEGRDVVDDVRRLGGFGIAAHPDSPHAELRWTAWDAPIDGLEIINPDTSWRVHAREGGSGRWRLVRGLFTYPVRPAETIGHLLTDSRVIETWNELTSTRPVVGVAGVDAHAKLELRDVDPGDNRYSLPFPGYESSFRTLSVHVAPDSPLTGEAAADESRIMDAIRSGRLYTAIDAWASPPRVEVTAANGRGSARPGQTLDAAGPLSLRVRSNAPPGFVASIWRGREAIATDRAESDFTVAADGRPGAYRVEVRSPDRPTGPAWITSNPMYIRSATPPAATAQRAIARSAPLFDGKSAAGWSIESDQSSLAQIEAVQMVSGMEIRLRYGLSGGARIGQFAGAAVGTRGVAEYDRVAFTIRGEHPMRMSLQLRAELRDAPPERWQRSIYLDAADRDLAISFDDMLPVGVTHSPRAPLADVRAIMFIVDTTNSKPGASGRVWIKNVRLLK